MADTISVTDFERAAEFLEANAERRVVVEQAWGEGSDDVSLLPERTREEELAELEAAQKWARTRFDAGFGWITGPTEYGGQGLTRDHARAYDAVEAGFEIPPMSVFGIGLGMVAPTILAHATDEVKGRYLRRCGAVTSWGANCSANRGRAATWPGCRRGRCATATSGW